MRIKEIEPKGNYVVLNLKKVTEGTDELFVQDKKSKLFLPNDPNGASVNPQKAVKSNALDVRWQAYVYKIGKSVEDADYKIGDMVIFNDYDAKYVGHEDDNMFIVIQAKNIMAVYEEEEPKEDD